VRIGFEWLPALRRQGTTRAVHEQTSPLVRGSAQGPAVVLFAKAPRPGHVKTRLCPPLTHDEAAALYGAFLRRTVVPQPDATTYLYGAPHDALGELRAYVPAGVHLRPQVGRDLWARLASCFAELFAAGHDQVVVRNTDSPDLPAARIDEALRACRPGRVVLGPDAGGGYYLIALAAPAAVLFDLSETPAQEVCAATVARARAAGLEVVALPAERDVDTYDDLLAMWAARRAMVARSAPDARATAP
jgi:hypothetical protein